MSCQDSINIQGKKARCNGFEFKIKKYKHIDDEIKKLKIAKKKLESQYFESMQLVLYDKKIDKKAFDALANELRQIDEQIDKLVSLKFIQPIDLTKELKDELQNMYKKPHGSAKDIAQRFVQMIKLDKEIRSNETHQRNEFVKVPMEVTKHKESSPKVTKHVKAPKEIPPPKTGVKVLTEETKTEIKHKIKDLLKTVYRFKDKAECTSKQRTKPFYMSKDDIIKEIDNSQELKKLMPQNYKKLSKEQLCEYFYQGN